MTPSIALADIYPNPKDRMHTISSFGGSFSAYHYWGSSVRCERQATVVFEKYYGAPRCEISVWEVSTKGGFSSRWDAQNRPYAHKFGLNWRNDNTLDIYQNAK